MNYGFFDETNREYCITNPATPAPWANYLGSPDYGAIISNNAGGYSFVKSGATGRIIRYHFNADDTPGRYIYLRDDDENDFWSASWQPVAKPLDVYKNECRHGTGYTKITSEYKDITCEALFYVPFGKSYEVWSAKIKNNSNKTRKLSAFGYAEFTTDSNYEQDTVNLQYTQFITRTYFENNKLRVAINENVKETVNGNNAADRFFGLAGNKVISYDGDKSKFIGNYHSYSNPVAVENGKCSDSLNYNSNPCGGLHTAFELKAGEEICIAFILGEKTADEAETIIASYKHTEKTVQKELNELKDYWHSKLNNFKVTTPDEKFNAMVNTWNAFQCFTTFVWSRAASFTYCGQRNGFGYRDTVQDIQGIIHLAPEMAKKQLVFMISAQVDNGAGLPLVKYTHNAGHEDTPYDESYVKETGHPHYRADDALWLFPTVYKYIAETGEISFLDEKIPFANKDEGTVYEHLKRAIEFSENHLAAHNMPAGLHADWNDCLRLGEKGESTFVAMQLYYAITILKGYAELKNDAAYIKYLDDKGKAIYDAIQNECWEGDRFIRGFTQDGNTVGAKKDPEASMWLNPQSWGVISGVASEMQGEISLNSVMTLLNTAHGAKLFTPAYKNHAFDGALMILFNAGTKENAGIFSQTQGWLILAESLLGHGNRAFQYFKETSPSYMNDKAEVRILEPYTHGQFVESDFSPNEGRAHVHWLTGTASTVMVGCVEGILGIRPTANGIKIEPAIPSTWDKVTIEKTFRGKSLEITVENLDGHESGVKKCILNGKTMDTDYIPASELKSKNKITVTL